MKEKNYAAAYGHLLGFLNTLDISLTLNGLIEPEQRIAIKDIIDAKLESAKTILEQ